jgi:hypothetical protein
MIFHIIFGEAAAGSLKVALKQRRKSDKVIAFADYFAIGPITQLETDTGVVQRTNWLKEHTHEDVWDPFFETVFEKRFRQSVQEIKDIPMNVSIIIWCGDNAHEQTGLRFVMALLKESTNNITVINTTRSYNRYCKSPDIYYASLHTGEVPPEKLNVILKKYKDEPLLNHEKDNFISEWNQLSSSHEVLRIWQGDQISSVASTYYDEFIIDKAKKLHSRQKDDYVKSVRLIGEVIGHLNEYIGDQFIKYRLRSLIEQGVFEYEGPLAGMRYYNIRLANDYHM